MKTASEPGFGISLESLAVLDAIDRRGSFAAAADELNRVPSALSYIIQKMEEQLGLTIFQRQGRKSVLTPSGKHLLQEGRKLLAAAQQLQEQTRSIASGWESSIRIAIDTMFNPDHAFKIIECFLSEHPDIEIDVQEEVMNGAWEALINDEVDLLLGGAAPVPQHKGIHALSIAKTDRVFAVSPAHPLANLKRLVASEDLEHYRAIVVHDSVHENIAWTRGIFGSGKRLYVTSMDQKIRAQLSGLGYGFLPRDRIADHIEHKRLICPELEPSLVAQETDMYLAWKIANKGKGLKNLRQCFIENKTLFKLPE